MRELKLKYFIELASNMGAKARSEAQAVEQSQKAMQGAINKTGTSLRALDSAYARFGANSSTERQIGYMRRLAQGVDQVTTKMRTLAAVALRNAPAAAAGVAGGFYAAKTLLDKPVDYDTRLRGATATAYAGQDAASLRQGLAQVRGLINGTVRTVSGATRDSTLGAYERLIGTGSFTKEESAQLLPQIMKTSVASRSNADDLVQAAEKLKMGELKLTAEQIPLALAKIMRGGQEGGFEIKDSAKHIGLLTPLMKGYKGMAGVEALVTMMQQVRSTSGSNDQAATNLVNFLQKIPAESTRKDFKKQGIDLDQEMVNGARKGLTPVDIYMAALEKVMAKQDPEGKARAAMRGADKAATPEEKKQQYDRIAEIYKSAGISKIIADIQEFGGYSGLAGTKEYGKKTLAAVRGEDGSAVNTGYDFMGEGSGAKFTDLANRKDIAASDALDSKSGLLNAGIDKVVALTDAFPATTAGAYSAATALGVLAVAAGGFSFLARRAAGGVPIPGVPGGALPGAAKAAGAFPILEGAAPAAAGSALGASAVIGGLAVGGAAMTYGAANLLRNNQAARDAMSADYAGDGAFAAAILNAADPINKPENHRGKGYNDPRLLTLTAPSIAEQTAAWTQPAKVELGEGKLAIDVRVTDDRASASTRLVAPMSSVKVSAGATNPGGVQ